MTRFEGTAPEMIDATLGEIMGPEAAHNGPVSYKEIGKLAAVASEATEFAIQTPEGEVRTYPLGDLYASPARPSAPPASRAA